MPRVVDHQARRTALAEALVRVAAARGLEAVSVRHVAAEAGVSLGTVQHYFRTKDELMEFALTAVGERVRARVEARPVVPDPRAMLRSFLVELLPLDERRRAEGLVALAFHAWVAVRPGAAAELRRDVALLRSHLARLLPDGDEGTAGTLLALMEGLSLHVLVGHWRPEQAEAALDTQLALVFAGDGRMGA